MENKRPEFPTTPATRLIANCLISVYWVVMALLGFAVYMQY